MPKKNPTKRAEVGPIAPTPPAFAELVGQRFGRLEVVGYTGTSKRPGQKLFACRCDCGSYVDVAPYSLRCGNTTSCGCAHREFVVAKNVAAATHGHASGGTLTPEYRAWAAMMARCYSKTHEHYDDYGGRGITVYVPWHDPTVFLAAIGERPSPAHSLERLNNELGYFPGNAAWASPTEQARNLRTTERYELDGDNLTLGEWAELAGMPYEVVKKRVWSGWPLDQALGTPVGLGRLRKERRSWKP